LKTTDRVAEITESLVTELGFALCDVEFAKEYGNWVLTLFIDKEGGVTVDDCERVSRAVEPLLDEADPIEQSYYLSVSSLGLDRPIKKDADFVRNVGKRIEVKLYAPQNGSKELAGTLIAWNADSFTITDEKQRQICVLRKDAALVRPEILF